MSDPVNFAFIARDPDGRPPPLTAWQVEELAQYMEALAQVREDQAQELGHDPHVFAEPPQQLRGNARFLRRLYESEARRMNPDP